MAVQPTDSGSAPVTILLISADQTGEQQRPGGAQPLCDAGAELGAMQPHRRTGRAGTWSPYLCHQQVWDATGGHGLLLPAERKPGGDTEHHVLQLGPGAAVLPVTHRSGRAAYPHCGPAGGRAPLAAAGQEGLTVRKAATVMMEDWH